MSDTMLHDVLNMPPELWSDSEIDKTQRYGRYRQASKRIKDLNRALVALTGGDVDGKWQVDVIDSGDWALIRNLLKEAGH